MRRFRNVLLDDGGVMNDNNVRGREWQRLVGEYFAPRLGGAKEAWSEANHVVFTQMWSEFEDLIRPVQEDNHDTYFDFFGEQRARWLRDMCARVGVSVPDRGTAFDLGFEAEAFVLPRVRSAYPGAAEAIRALHAAGYRLGTASGQTARELDGYLLGLGVRELFPERLYGPDLVRAMKGTTWYYERIFHDAEIDPSETLIADDSPLAVQRASEAGAATVLVGAHAQHHHKADFVIDRLAELPSLLDV